MGFNDFWINNNGKKEQLNNAKHGVRKEQMAQKFHNLFDAYDTNKDGTLEESELNELVNGLAKFSGADKTLDTSENKKVASLFSNQVNIQDADFMGFVKSVSDASEEIVSSETTKGDDGGNIIKTTYENGLVETIYYYPDGEFKLKTQKQDSVTESTTYIYTNDGKNYKQCSQAELDKMIKDGYKKQRAAEQRSDSTRITFEDGYKSNFMKSHNVIPQTNRHEIHIDNTDMSDRAKAEAEIRDFVISHYVQTHKDCQAALDTMGILDDIGAAINAGAGELWNSCKNIYNKHFGDGTESDYQNFYELVKKFEPNYDKAIATESRLESLREHPAGYFTGEAANINTEKGLVFQQTTEQYQNAQILKSRIDILNKAMLEISMYESEQNAITYAPAQSEGMNPASHILNASNLLLEYFGGDKEAVNMLLNGAIGNAQSTINAIKEIANDTQKMFDSVTNGKTFDEIKNDYQSQYKEIYGTDFVPDELTEKVMDAKATGGMVKLTAITIISILVTKSPIMANLSAAAGGAEATGAAANMIRTLVTKYGSTAVQQGIKFAMSSGTLATDVGLTLLNQLSSERGVDGEELWESAKGSAKYIYFGAYIGAPLAQAVSKQLGKIGATANLFNGGTKTLQGAIQTTKISGEQLVQNLMKGGSKVLTTGGAFLTDVAAFSALEIATEGLDPITAGKEQTEMLGKLKIMNHFIEYMLGGKVHAGMSKARMDAAIERSGIKNWQIKEIKSPSKTIYEVEVGEGLPKVRFEDANTLTTAMMEKVTAIYESQNARVESTNELINLDQIKEKAPSQIMKPTEATTFGKNEGITFKPNVNPNDAPSNAYKIEWGKTVEETIELNKKNGVPLELVKDETTGEYFLGVKHSWDNDYYRVDRNSIIVKYGEGDFAPVAEDNGAHIFTQTYLDAKTGKPIDVSKMKPGEPVQIVKNPNSTVGAVAFEKPTTVNSLEGKMQDVEMARTDVDGHPYGTYEQLAKDIRKGKLVANEADPNSARFIELVKAGKDTEAMALLKNASIKPSTSRVELPAALTTELKDLYNKKNLTRQEQARVAELEQEVQNRGFLVARSPIIESSKISMLAKSEPREAFLPDFNNPQQLREMGFTQEADGKWYHSNRDWYPNGLSENDVVYVFKRDASGKPIDTGFGPKDELPSLYVRTEDFDANNMKFVNPNEMTPGQMISVKKCASGNFCILPAGTKLFTSEGIVEVKPGEIVNIKESKNSVHTSNISDVPDMYKADPLNPASKRLFDLIEEYKAKEATLSEAEKVSFQARIADTFNRINRGQKLCALAPDAAENPPQTLRQEYDLAAKIAANLENKYLSRIDVSNFDNALSQARDVLTEIYADKTLTPEQQSAAVTAVMVKLLPKTNAHQHTKGSLPKETAMQLAVQKGYTPEQIAELEAAYKAGDAGFETLSAFNNAYGTIGRLVNTPSDYRIAIDGIIRKAIEEGQLTTEIRCACDSLRDENGRYLSPEEGTKVILDAIEETKAQLRAEGKEVPATGYVFLTYRGRDWDASLPAAAVQARQAVKSAMEHPDMKFGFDIAGPEDSGWGPKAFDEAVSVIREYNEKVDRGEVQGQRIGITMHAGETPTFDGGRPGYLSVQEAIEMGVDRIGHGVQAVLDEPTMQMMKDADVTVEICGVCNIQSIPINTEGLPIHPIQQFIDRGIKVSLCTDNDAICGSNITKEYNQFLLTGHSNFMNWNNVKQSARDGIEAAFIPEADKAKARTILENRINQIQKLQDEVYGKAKAQIRIDEAATQNRPSAIVPSAEAIEAAKAEPTNAHLAQKRATEFYNGLTAEQKAIVNKHNIAHDDIINIHGVLKLKLTKYDTPEIIESRYNTAIRGGSLRSADISIETLETVSSIQHAQMAGVPRERKLYLITGRAGGGKSTIAKNLKLDKTTFMPDADELKPFLPGYKENGASYVHEASVALNTAAIQEAFSKGINMTIQTTGWEAYIDEIVSQAKQNGYTDIVLIHTDVTAEHSIERATSRAAQTGRTVDPAFIESRTYIDEVVTKFSDPAKGIKEIIVYDNNGKKPVLKQRQKL